MLTDKSGRVVMSGWDAARSVASWLNGQEARIASEFVDSTEEIFNAYQSEKLSFDTERSEKHSVIVGNDKSGVSDEARDVSTFSEGMGKPDHIEGSPETVRSSMQTIDDVERGEDEAGSISEIARSQEYQQAICSVHPNKFTPGDWCRKCWGWTRSIFSSPHCIVCELKTHAGWQCSWHYHKARSNRFIVQSGLIGIESQASGQDIKRLLLHPGDIHDIHPLISHRFFVL